MTKEQEDAKNFLRENYKDRKVTLDQAFSDLGEKGYSGQLCDQAIRNILKSIGSYKTVRRGGGRVVKNNVRTATSMASVGKGGKKFRYRGSYSICGSPEAI